MVIWFSELLQPKQIKKCSGYEISMQDAWQFPKITQLFFLNLHPVKFQQFSATTSRKKSCSLAREPKRWDDNTGSLQCTDLRALPQSSHSPCTHKKPKHSYTGCQSYSFSPAANAPNSKRRNTVTFSVYPSISL